MAKKVIKMGLNTRDINRAIKEVRRYKQEVIDKTKALVEALTDRGVEVARVQLVQMGAEYTGQLSSSMVGYFSPSTGVGIIRAGAWYAVFVEFGTGVVGAGSPHPDPTGWQYDVNGHGDKGWVYFNENDQKWHWTKGMESRPFMYNTARTLEKECLQIAKEVWVSHG